VDDHALASTLWGWPEHGAEVEHRVERRRWRPLRFHVPPRGGALKFADVCSGRKCFSSDRGVSTDAGYAEIGTERNGVFL
jgi:hypothetical protein